MGDLFPLLLRLDGPRELAAPRGWGLGRRAAATARCDASYSHAWRDLTDQAARFQNSEIRKKRNKFTLGLFLIFTH